MCHISVATSVGRHDLECNESNTISYQKYSQHMIECAALCASDRYSI